MPSRISYRSIRTPSLFPFYLLATILISLFKLFVHFPISHLQFIREYTGKVDELIKAKLEAQKEVKAKEAEEKDMVAQQVCFIRCLDVLKTSWFQVCTILFICLFVLA